MKPEHLFSEFPPVSREEWEKVIREDLKGDDYTSRLRWETGEGVRPLPFYRREDLPEGSGGTVDAPSGWSIVQQICRSDPGEANEEARKALGRGAEALRFCLRIEVMSGMLGGDLSGVALRSQEAMDRLLREIDLEKVPLHFDASMASPAVLAMLCNALRERGSDPGGVKVTLLHDPWSRVLEHGHLPQEGASPHAASGALLSAAKEWELTHARCLGVDCRLYHRAGATIVQELAFALATASEYLAQLGEEGFDTGKIARSIHFCFSVGSSYFPEMAKFRAMRLLWKNLCGAYGMEKAPHAWLAGESSTWNKTLYAPYTNMLRSTTEGMSAALAGCDALVLHPYDETFGESDDFSKRISRNAQIIMKEEAYLDRVSDPGAGSYYIEQLTDELALRAWDLFREIERQGGFYRAIRDGFIQSAVRESREERDRSIALRKRVFVGTSQYPRPGEEALERKRGPKHQTVSITPGEEKHAVDQNRLVSSMAEALRNGAGMGDLAGHLVDAGRQEIGALRPYRGAEAFEELRLATERHARTPSVLTLPMGDRRMRKARSSFAVNFLGCAGYEIEDPLGFESAGEAMDRVREADPDLVVLCSSDAEYETLVPRIAGRLAELKRRPLLLLAGKPSEAFREEGVDLFIHAKSDVMETLRELQRRLGVTETG